MSKTVLVPIADGVEEIETVSVIDVLRRAGAVVTVASVGDGLQIKASRGVNLVADQHIRDCANQTYDLIAIPGGMPGAENLRDSPELTDLLKKQKQEQRYHAAICAAPAVVFQAHGLISGKATCHPNFANQLPNQDDINSRVVIDGMCVTSRGPGTALEFALKLVEILYGQHKMEEVADPMLAKL
ncbi:MAG: DJ-1/PfpI family protein [SAR324 cluster bacterium]|nr:DJ-1/PfpI family protein [SAR324 cluster bacterium]